MILDVDVAAGPLAAGAVAYLPAGIAEWGALRGIRGVKAAGWAITGLLHAWAVPAAASSVSAWTPGGVTRVVGAILAVAGGALLLWSFALEIPFVTSWVRSSPGHRLVDTGTYALVRHPGVLWYALLLAGLLLATGSGTLVVALPLWISLDVAYVAWEEAVVFPVQFEDYARYQRTTPMLVPTLRSLRRALGTLGRRATE
jgi:protein-S-isoprenylcysteine O-methyltransferase Ste14